MDPLVSVITPTYNHERYIAACVESVFGQTYPYWEQVIVDDGSEDGTLEVLSRYRDDRLRVVRLPHRGLAHLGETYNVALAHARGDLIAILEGDDFLPLHRYSVGVDPRMSGRFPTCVPRAPGSSG
jgi:glycosyltransferase involved in cell wall biosynthesis